MKLNAFIVFIGLSFSGFLVFNSDKEICGTVTEENLNPLLGVGISVLESGDIYYSDIDGKFCIPFENNKMTLHIEHPGYNSERIAVKSNTDALQIILKTKKQAEQVFYEQEIFQDQNILQEIVMSGSSKMRSHPVKAAPFALEWPSAFNTEDYGLIRENKFQYPGDEAFSTFSIDVDRASYSNIRRFIENSSLPPKDAVRIEEMVNYFDYSYEQPDGEDPMAVYSSLVDCPWNPEHQVLHLAIQGKKISNEELPPSNLVLLIDVSGSMMDYNKLPLVKSSFHMLLDHLRPEDRVAIVVYAGRTKVVLPSTPGSQKAKIRSAINKLQAGGSTAGGAGIVKAYDQARKYFLKDGNNRVILATDGDFNVGVSSDAELVRLIEIERESGIFLSVLGYGMGNYKDNKIQQLADYGNGNHAYIDNIKEARKVLVQEFGGTLFTIAKDVKVQIEFNPSTVQAYRLIGYENRMLDKEDFNNDNVDAGEIGSGHVVTALYEIIPVGSDSKFLSDVDPMKYQEKATPITYFDYEIGTIKLRYKEPDGQKSKRIVSTIFNAQYEDQKSSYMEEDVLFSLVVAEFGMLLRDSKYVSNTDYDQVLTMARKVKGKDPFGYRREFIELVEIARDLKTNYSTVED